MKSTIAIINICFFIGTVSSASTINNTESIKSISNTLDGISPNIILLANDDIENSIPGSSDYVPVKETKPKISNSTLIDGILSNMTAMNLTNSNANVFEAVPHSGKSEKDPFQINAQQQNPFLSGVGGMNPQIAMILRNNPRLQILARQNPIIAQQIMRNPQLLRDPMIQRAIQSQLSQRPGQSLLGQIGQLGLNGLNGLGRAIGLPINPLNRGNNDLNNLNQNRLNQLNQLNQNQDMRNYGIPQNHRQNFGQLNPHQDTLNGGYYGDNDNYSNPPAENNEVDGENNGEDENSVDPGHQDYGDNTEENGESGAGGADDSQQNPADDPDIQQLQNFGGPINDNFPEGLFPPGLLSKEDIEEIRRQQEKQQREAEERERRQQQHQQETASPDYENSGIGEGGEGEESPTTEYPEGAGEEENGGGEEYGNENVNEHQSELDHMNINKNNEQNNAHIYTTQSPPAFRNVYQPIQPGHGNVQPHINYHNEYQNVPQHDSMSKNQFNLEPNVEYDSNDGHDKFHHKHHDHGYTSTYSPPLIKNGVHFDSHGPHSHFRSHHNQFSPNNVRSGNFHNQPMIHHPYSRPKISQWTPGHQVSTFNKARDGFTRSTLYQDDDVSSPENGGTQDRLINPPTTYSNYLSNQYLPGRTTAKHQRPGIF